jgi:hypothetical protein
LTAVSPGSTLDPNRHVSLPSVVAAPPVPLIAMLERASRRGVDRCWVLGGDDLREVPPERPDLREGYG